MWPTSVHTCLFGAKLCISLCYFFLNVTWKLLGLLLSGASRHIVLERASLTRNCVCNWCCNFCLYSDRWRSVVLWRAMLYSTDELIRTWMASKYTSIATSLGPGHMPSRSFNSMQRLVSHLYHMKPICLNLWSKQLLTHGSPQCHWWTLTILFYNLSFI